MTTQSAFIDECKYFEIYWRVRASEQKNRVIARIMNARAVEWKSKRRDLIVAGYSNIAIFDHSTDSSFLYDANKNEL